MGSRNTGHSTGRKAGLRHHRQESSAVEPQCVSPACPSGEWRAAFLAARDALVSVRTTAAVVQRSLTAEEGDPNAAAVLLEGVCYPLAEIIGTLENLNAAVQS
jgi:hypothetical protein